MRRSISRYLIPIPDNGRFSLKLTPEAEILTVEKLEDELSIYILMNLDARLEINRDFLIVGTEDVIEEDSLDYIGTLQLPRKTSAFHLFGFHLFEIK